MNRFREARLRHGAQTVKEVSAETGVTASLISDLESEIGRARNVGYMTVAKLAQHYGVTADFLCGLTDTPSTDPDIQTACATTGLSQEAIDALQTSFAMLDEAFGVTGAACASDFIASPEFERIISCLFDIRAAGASVGKQPDTPEAEAIRAKAAAAPEIFVELCTYQASQALSAFFEREKGELNNGQH